MGPTGCSASEIEPGLSASVPPYKGELWEPAKEAGMLADSYLI